MRTRATDNGPVDGWRAARIAAIQREQIRRLERQIPAEIDIGEPQTPRVTIALLLLIVFATAWQFTAFGTSPGVSELARAGGAGIGALATGAWWKLITANLLHGGLLHLAMNVFVIYLMGRWLEHLAGRTVLVAVIGWSAVMSSLGALLIDTASVTIGASGIAFGLVGCAVAIDPRAKTATGVIARQLAVVNIIGTFVIPGISIGGHLGGLAAGLAVGLLTKRHRAAIAAIVLVAPVFVVLVVGPSALPEDGARVNERVVAPLLARQLSGAQLDDGTKLNQARCHSTPDARRYRCTVDGEQVLVTFRTRDDQWSLVRARG